MKRICAHLPYWHVVLLQGACRGQPEHKAGFFLGLIRNGRGALSPAVYAPVVRQRGGTTERGSLSGNYSVFGLVALGLQNVLRN
jgi:hypothetical protein